MLFRVASDSPDPLADAGLVLLPDGASNASDVNRAMAHGIPVVGARTEETVELVGPAGVCIPDTAGLVGWTDAIARIWQNPSRYAGLEQQARVRAAQMRTEFRESIRGLIDLIDELGNEIRLQP